MVSLANLLGEFKSGSTVKKSRMEKEQPPVRRAWEEF